MTAPEHITRSLTAVRQSIDAAAGHLATLTEALGRDWPDGTPPPPPPPAPTGKFTVRDGQIFDPGGEAWRAVGWNCTGAISYDWGEEWIPHGYVAEWAALGVTCIRHVAYQRVSPRNHPAVLMYGTLDDLAAECAAAKVVLIVDCHEGPLGGPWSDAMQARAVELLAPIAARHKDNPWVWVEVQNEPHDEYGPAARLWLDRSMAVAQAIRTAGNRSPIVVCESNFGQGRGPGRDVAVESAAITYGPQLAAAVGPVVVDMHAYSRWAWPAGAATDAALGDYLGRLRALGLPVIVGEVGAYSDGWELVPGDRAGAERLFRVLDAGAPCSGVLPWMHGDRAAQGVSPWPLFWRWARSTPAPVDPPPSGRPHVEAVVAEPLPGGLRVVWQTVSSGGVTGHVVAWGAAGGFLGAADLPAGAREHTIVGLAGGVEHTADVMVRTVTGADAAGKVTVRATPLPAGTGPGPTPPPLPPAPGGDVRARIVAGAGARLPPGAPVLAAQSGDTHIPAGGLTGVTVAGLIYHATRGPLRLTDVVCRGVWCAMGAGPIHATRVTDGVTCFGGLITIRGSVVEMPASETQVNGALWADGGDFDVSGSVLTAPVQVLNARAGRTIRLVGCRVEGRRVGAGSIIET